MAGTVSDDDGRAAASVVCSADQEVESTGGMERKRRRDQRGRICDSGNDGDAVFVLLCDTGDECRCCDNFPVSESGNFIVILCSGIQSDTESKRNHCGKLFDRRYLSGGNAGKYPCIIHFTERPDHGNVAGDYDLFLRSTSGTAS